MSAAAALQEIDHGLGTLFDPQLVEGFIALIGTTPFRDATCDWIGS
jgi:response regulator RpfG family c-di-GMP phosphodiesterase